MSLFGSIANIFTLGAYGAVKKALTPPDLPTIPKAPLPVTQQDPIVLRAAEDERRRLAGMMGRQSTITAPLVGSNTQNFKTILGG